MVYIYVIYIYILQKRDIYKKNDKDHIYNIREIYIKL